MENPGSISDQILKLQRDALRRARCRQLYEERASDKHATRPKLNVCLKSLREGDTLIVSLCELFGISFCALFGILQMFR